MGTRIKTRYTGVYQRISDTRLHENKPDICFDINYRIDNRLKWEKVGWVSEGYSAKLATQIRSERLRSIRHGQDLPDKKKTPYFKDVAKKYLEWSKQNKSRAGYCDQNLYKNHLEDRFNNKLIKEISSFDLERMKSDLFKKGLAPATVKHCLVLFRQIINKAIAWDMYEGENPIKGVKMPTLQNQRERFLSHEEANLLLNELAEVSIQLHDMALLSLQTGMRAGEIFNLKGQDLDFNNGLINISDPKNGETRKAYMTPTVKETLSKRSPISPNEFVFKDKWHKGKIVWVSGAFGRVVDSLGLNEGVTDPRQKITFHSLRHTFASWLALQGETLLTIKNLLGHKSLAMTERYSHLTPDHKMQAVLKLEKAFLKTKPKVQVFSSN
jgi:integrase